MRYFAWYFLLMGIANVSGGIFGHAFQSYFSFSWKLPGWIISMFSVMFVERAAIQHTKLIFSKRIITTLLLVNVIELATFVFLTIYHVDFFYVEAHSVYGLLIVVASLEGILYYKTRNLASKQLLIAVFFAFLTAVFFVNKWDIHQWFNHLVICHLLMTVAIYFMFKGVKLIPKQ